MILLIIGLSKSYRLIQDRCISQPSPSWTSLCFTSNWLHLGCYNLQVFLILIVFQLPFRMHVSQDMFELIDYLVQLPAKTRYTTSLSSLMQNQLPLFVFIFYLSWTAKDIVLSWVVTFNDSVFSWSSPLFSLQAELISLRVENL